MDTIDHPSRRISAESAQVLSEFAHAAEVSGELHPKQVELLHSQRWLRMFIPKRYDGLALTLPEVVRLEEALSWADGSTAWVATLCSGAGWFVGFVDHAIAKEFFTGNNLCIAGSGSTTGTAEIHGDEYVINGSWPFASGALHATAFTVNCAVLENGEQKLNMDGTPRVLSFLLKAEQVVIGRTWAASGMVATGSHSFSIVNATVPANRAFEIHPSAVRIEAPVYRFPFLQLAESTLAGNISGMTIRFIELVGDCISKCNESNDTDRRHRTVTQCNERLFHLRLLMFSNIDEAWRQLTWSQLATAEALQAVSETCLDLVRECRVTIETLYPLCTNEDIAYGTALNRVFRNIKTALTHALFRDRI